MDKGNEGSGNEIASCAAILLFSKFSAPTIAFLAF